MDDNFSTLNPTFWSHEIQTGGYGSVPSFLLPWIRSKLTKFQYRLLRLDNG